MERSEFRGDKEEKNKFPPIENQKGWSYQVIEASRDLLKIGQELKIGSETRQETGVYKKTRLEELGADFYILDEAQSTSGCLPHGAACYLKEWGVILVRQGPYGLEIKDGELNNNDFTVLAHELGHKKDHEESDAAEREKLTYAEKEIRAWERAKIEYGGNPKFDHQYANSDIESYKN